MAIEWEGNTPRFRWDDESRDRQERLISVALIATFVLTFAWFVGDGTLDNDDVIRRSGAEQIEGADR